MNPKLLWAELRKYGYVFSWRKSIITYGAVVMATLGLGMLFRLQGIYLFVLCLWVVLWLPFFLRNIYKNRYNQQHFLEANTYMEQFLYSFQKSGKVLTTLEDVAKLFTKGEMHRVITEAIYHIRHTYEENDVSQNALQIIEDSYCVPQISTMHRFALQVEKIGGEYAGAIMLMLDARRMWVDRVYELLKEKNRRRVQILVSVFASLLLCTILLFVAERIQVDITEYPVTKVSTLVVLMLDFYIFYRGDSKLSTGYMEEEMPQGDYLRQYEKVKKSQRMGGIGLGVGIAKRHVTRGIQMLFPRWLMEVSLLLQSENVQVAIAKSYEDAPALLKPELKILIEKLRLHPTDMEPYLSFFQDYPLPEVQSAMKMLYSISEGTGGNASNQISDIIRRNQVLMNTAEQMKNEDALAGMYALFLAPQLTGSLKLLVDMLAIFYGLAQMGTLTP